MFANFFCMKMIMLKEAWRRRSLTTLMKSLLSKENFQTIIIIMFKWNPFSYLYKIEENLEKPILYSEFWLDLTRWLMLHRLGKPIVSNSTDLETFTSCMNSKFKKYFLFVWWKRCHSKQLWCYCSIKKYAWTLLILFTKKKKKKQFYVLVNYG